MTAVDHYMKTSVGFRLKRGFMANGQWEDVGGRGAGPAPKSRPYVARPVWIQETSHKCCCLCGKTERWAVTREGQPYLEAHECNPEVYEARKERKAKLVEEYEAYSQGTLVEVRGGGETLGRFLVRQKMEEAAFAKAVGLKPRPRRPVIRKALQVAQLEAPKPIPPPQQYQAPWFNPRPPQPPRPRIQTSLHPDLAERLRVRNHCIFQIQLWRKRISRLGEVYVELSAGGVVGHNPRAEEVYGKFVSAWKKVRKWEERLEGLEDTPMTRPLPLPGG